MYSSLSITGMEAGLIDSEGIKSVVIEISTYDLGRHPCIMLRCTFVVFRHRRLKINNNSVFLCGKHVFHVVGEDNIRMQMNKTFFL